MKSRKGKSVIRNFRKINLKCTALPLFFTFIVLASTAFGNTILKFEGVVKYKSVFFTWDLDPTVSIQFKEIEKSVDSVNFNNCLSFGGNNIKVFAWDKQPLNGKSFYRLKVTDSNGIVEYSSIIPITVKTSFHVMDLRPDTLSSGVCNKISKTESLHYTVLLYDMNGKIRSKRELISSIDINTASLMTCFKEKEYAILVVLQENTVISKKVYFINE